MADDAPADEENQNNSGEALDKDEEDKKKNQGLCFEVGTCLLGFFKGLYNIIKDTIM